MLEPLWLNKGLVLELHDDVLAETGGAPGLRDEGLLDSALARPINRFLYEGVDDLLELAAAYAVAVASNHAFVDGNKRAAFMCLGLFLADNGLSLAATIDDATSAMLAVAVGEMDIPALSAWLKSRIEPALE